MAGRVENINKDILRQSREQIGLSLSIAAKKVAKIAVIEQGDQKPTFKQLDTLAELYKVPRWVFISDHLPEKYQFDKAIPAFRQLANSNADVFSDHKVRSLTARVDRFRKMIIELQEDMGEIVPVFNPPKVSKNAAPDHAAQQIRDWLKLSNDRHDFAGLKKMLEEKGIFIFMTSKYMGWSHIDKALFRGLTIYHSRLPIIIINDSDAKKAQSFTLFHELGHLLRKESTIDDWEDFLNEVEAWCNELAGNVLMPAEQILSAVDSIDDLDAVKDIAKSFQVSPYACLVRLRQMQIIDRDTYKDFEDQLKAEYRKLQKKLKESDGGPSRNRPREILNQYGRIYTTAIFQAYHNQEIGFHKLCRLFDLKNPSYALELEGYI
ncbi:MAG: ImmA/IrrE family metallo-endopeptidase [Deltaproteobacteria bacterium]|nr:ImmA/IrrE family metallo-endopeptidase [Deltaproteobacteria bacterium]MBW2663430.1 ImmA/IrrE family metallo-endopeptidase [Deltaproteobacteria bacterium]